MANSKITQLPVVTVFPDALNDLVTVVLPGEALPADQNRKMTVQNFALSSLANLPNVSINFTGGTDYTFDSATVITGALSVNSTEAAKIPVGTTAQRPTPLQGMMRYNTTDSIFEGYNGSTWGALGGGGGGVGTLSQTLAAGNTSGANNLVIDSGQVITTNTISETTAASGVTIDGTLIKDGVVTADLTGNVTGNADTVTTNANLTGPITSLGNATTITADSVSMDMIVDIATDTFLGRVTAATGTVEVLTNAQAKTALDLTGTNSGDQTSIVGISGTVAEFNTAITDATLSGSNTGDQTSIVGISGTTAEFNTANSDGTFAIAGGAFHDGFSDFVANEHINWTSTSSALSTTGTLASGDITITGTGPSVDFYESDAGADEKIWVNRGAASNYQLVTLTDAGAAGKTAMQFTRTGTVIDTIQYGNATDDPTHTFNGAGTFTGTLDSGALTVTGTGSFTSDVTLSGTGALTLPSGTDAQRTVALGAIRWNTTSSNYEGYNGATWDNLSGGGAGSGDFVGPASSTDNAVVRFDGATGKLGQNSGVLIDDLNNITGVGTLASGNQTITSSATTGNAEQVTANSLTSGNGLYLNSSSAVTGSMLYALNTSATFSGQVLRVEASNAGSTGYVARITNAGTGNGVFIDQNGNGTSINVDSEATSADGVYIHAGSTSGYALNVAAGDVNVGAGNITVTGQYIENESPTGTSGAVTIDLDLANNFSTAMAGAVTYTFSNPAISGLTSAFTLKVTNNGSAITWPASVRWAGGTAPSLSATTLIDIFTFYTNDAGANWYGFVSGQDMS